MKYTLFLFLSCLIPTAFTDGHLVNNKLRHVKDAVTSIAYSFDIDNQVDDNYSYNNIGNLVANQSESNMQIRWNVYGKIEL